MNDADFLAAVLSDGKPHTTNEILHASFRERGCGLTVHSRASDLRNKRHLNIACKAVGKVDGRNVFEYQLLPGSLPRPEDDCLGPVASGSESDFSPREAGAAAAPLAAVPDISFAKQLEIWSAA